MGVGLQHVSRPGEINGLYSTWTKSGRGFSKEFCSWLSPVCLRGPARCSTCGQYEQHQYQLTDLGRVGPTRHFGGSGEELANQGGGKPNQQKLRIISFKNYLW